MKKEIKEYQNKLMEVTRNSQKQDTEQKQMEKENKQIKDLNKALELAVQEVGESHLKTEGENTT